MAAKSGTMAQPPNGAETKSARSKKLGRRPKTTPTQSAAANGQPTSELMLDVAARLFADKGFDSVSIREIAELSGVTLPSLYYHFGDKRGLYLQAFRREFLVGSQAFIQALSQNAEPQARVRNATAAICHRLIDPGPLANMLLRYVMERDQDFIRDLATDYFVEWFELFTDNIGIIALGRNPRELAFTVMSLAFGMVVLQPLNKTLHKRVPNLQTPENLADTVLKTVFPELHW